MKAGLPLIAARRITFGYEPGRNVIRNLSLEIRRGDKFAFLGPNGAGKTTLANLLAGTLVPQRGRVDYHPSMIDSSGRKSIAFVRQSLSVFPTLSVGEHFRLLEREILPNAVRPSIEACLQRVGARFPLSSPVDSLSFSARQLLEIALALWQRTQVLILDEPTSALDVKAVDTLFRVLEDLAREGVAIILISHSPSEVTRLGAKRVTLGKLPTNSPARNRSSANAAMAVAEADAATLPIFGRPLRLSRGTPTVVQFEDAHERSRAWQDALDPRMVHNIERSGSVLRVIPSDRQRFAMFPGLSAIQNAHLLARKDVTPKDLASFSIALPSWEHQVSALSGGNQQKLVLASILASRPGIVLAEEPLLGLDQQARSKLVSSLRHYTQEGGKLAIFTCFPESYRDLEPRVFSAHDAAAP